MMPMCAHPERVCTCTTCMDAESHACAVGPTSEYPRALSPRLRPCARTSRLRTQNSEYNTQNQSTPPHQYKARAGGTKQKLLRHTHDCWSSRERKSSLFFLF